MCERVGHALQDAQLNEQLAQAEEGRLRAVEEGRQARQEADEVEARLASKEGRYDALLEKVRVAREARGAQQQQLEARETEIVRLRSELTQAQGQLSDAVEITTAPHVLDHNQTGSYLVFQPEANQGGTPYAAFNVSLQLAEEPTLISEPVTVTIDLAAVDDVPTTHAFNYTVTEARRVKASGETCTDLNDSSCSDSGGKQTVQLLATDDPYEPDQPLEIFITSLPKLGTVQSSSLPCPAPSA